MRLRIGAEVPQWRFPRVVGVSCPAAAGVYAIILRNIDLSYAHRKGPKMAMETFAMKMKQVVLPERRRYNRLHVPFQTFRGLLRECLPST